MIEKLEKLTQSFGIINIQLGERPVNLKQLANFQYLQEVTEKSIIVANDITTITGDKNE